METRERKHRITLRLSEEEYRILREKMKECDYRDMSQTLRHLIVYGFLYEVDYSYLRENNIALGRIGTNINQIAHKVNETGSVFQSDIDDLRKEMDEIWQLQRSMLSKQLYRQQ